jgi:hypothetical protein
MKNKPIRLGLVLFSIIGLCGCNRTESDWKQAREANTTAAYTDFIAKHKQGAHVDDAQNAIDELDWATARAKNAVDAYNRYLTDHSKGKHLIDAQSGLDELEWSTASSKNSIEAYKAYLVLRGPITHAPQAQKAITNLIETQEWAETTKDNSRSAYEKFVAHFTSSLHLAEAQSKLTELSTLRELKPTSAFSDGAHNEALVSAKIIDGHQWLLFTIKKGSTALYCAQIAVVPNNGDSTAGGSFRTSNGEFTYAHDGVFLGAHLQLLPNSLCIDSDDYVGRLDYSDSEYTFIGIVDLHATGA